MLFTFEPDFKNINPYLVQAYAGRTKPLDVDDYMKEFSRELIELEENGVFCGQGNIHKNFKIRCFICDAPAASFVTGRVGHSSKKGCPRCDQLCGTDGRRLLYQNNSGTLRTDESFLFRDDTWHHRPAFMNDHSELERVGIGMVSQFVIDPMHNIDLGNTYKIIRAIIKNQSPISHLSTIAFNAMNERFISFYNYTPSEFERKPRTLKDLDLFTGSELRQLLLYTLPVMLKGFVSEQLHRQVLLLHTAVRLLDDPINYLENLPAARQFIDLFVLQYSDSFGIQNFTYNTHCLLHIPDDVERYGPLYSISAYKSENHMRILKGLLRKKHMDLQQFSNRFAEISNASELLKDARALSKGIGEFQFNNFILKANSLRDGCIMVQPGVPLIITGLREVNGTKIIQGRRFLRYENFFDFPVSSMENLGIILASQLSVLKEEFPIDSVIHKYYRLPFEDKFVLIPLIHSS